MTPSTFGESNSILNSRGTSQHLDFRADPISGFAFPNGNWNPGRALQTTPEPSGTSQLKQLEVGPEGGEEANSSSSLTPFLTAQVLTAQVSKTG